MRIESYPKHRRIHTHRPKQRFTVGAFLAYLLITAIISIAVYQVFIREVIK